MKFGSDFYFLFWYFVDPWEHLLGMGIGAVATNQMVKWEAKSNEDLDKLLEKARLANERRYFGMFHFKNFFVECLNFFSTLYLYFVFVFNFFLKVCNYLREMQDLKLTI